MGRAPRIEFPGALYHVINRGNNKNSTVKRTHNKTKDVLDIKT